MKGLILYEGKYGATQQYARWLGEELQLPVFRPKNITTEELICYDYIILGSSVYVGRLLIGKWMKQHAAVLQTKKLFLFVVCATPGFEVEKLQTLVRSNIPPALLDRCTVHFLRGRMIFKKLSWVDKLVLKMGASIQKDPKQKTEMLTDFDAVKKENIRSVMDAVTAFTGVKKTEAVRQLAAQ